MWMVRDLFEEVRGCCGKHWRWGGWRCVADGRPLLMGVGMRTAGMAARVTGGGLGCIQSVIQEEMADCASLLARRMLQKKLASAGRKL
jgi:hypothetical protein